MYITPKYWMVILFTLIPVHAWAKTSASSEVSAYALMEGYKIPFKIRSEAGNSKSACVQCESLGELQFCALEWSMRSVARHRWLDGGGND